MNIGERIKMLRESNDMLQQELADKLGVTRQAISAWEQGRALPRMGTIEQLCEALKCTKDDLIGPDFNEHIQAMNDKEIILLQDFRDVDKQTKEMVLRILHIAKMENKK
jgi:transcriptional regulator with XRE-family HTH domain